MAESAATSSPRKRPEVETPDPADSPRRGASNISTSTSSFEAGVQHDPNLNRLAVNMFTKTEQFLQGELDSVLGGGTGGVKRPLARLPRGPGWNPGEQLGSAMENGEEVLMELTRFEAARHRDIPPVLEDYLRHVARTGDSVFPWLKVRPLLKRKLDVVADQYCEQCPPEKIPAMPNVEPFNYDQLRTEIHARIDSLSGTPFTIQRLCELMTEPQRFYKRTDKFMRGLEKNVLVVTTIEATRRRPPPPPEANGSAGPDEREAAAAASTSGLDRPPEPQAGQTEPSVSAADPEEAMETGGEPATSASDSASTEPVSDAATPADLPAPMEQEQPATTDPGPEQSPVQPPPNMADKVTSEPTEGVTSQSTEGVTSQSTGGVTSEPAKGVTSDPAKEVTSQSTEGVTSSEQRPAAPVDLTAVVTAPVQSADSPATEANKAPAIQAVNAKLPSTELGDSEREKPPSEPDTPSDHLPSVTSQPPEPSEQPVAVSAEKTDLLATQSSKAPAQSSELPAKSPEPPTQSPEPQTTQSSEPSVQSSEPSAQICNPSEPPSDTPEQPSEPSEQPSHAPETASDPSEPPSDPEAAGAADSVSLDSSNMSLDDSLCGSDAVAGSPPPQPTADGEQAA